MPRFFKVCLDDTCDAERKEFICAGAVVCTRDGWTDFNKEWRKELKREPSIDYWHGKDLPTLRGPFAKFRNKDLYPKPAGMDAAVAKRTALQRVLEDSQLVGFGVGVLIPEYNRIRESHPRAKTFMARDPFEYLVQELVYRTTTDVIGQFGTNSKMSFVSDQSDRSAVYEQVYKNWKKTNPKTAKSMLHLTHDDDKVNYGLQAADMVASTVNRVYRAHVKDGAIPEKYPLSEIMWRIGKIDEKYLLKMLGHQSPRASEQLSLEHKGLKNEIGS